MEPTTAPPARVPARDVAARPTSGRSPAADVIGLPELAGRAGVLSFGRLDAGSRQRLSVDLQRSAGNAAMQSLARRNVQREGDEDIPPNPYVVETPGGGARPELAANPYVEENDPVQLSNARFTGQPRLARIAAGDGVLSAADNGPAVQAVQQAFGALGFEMVFHGRDGQFGAETQDAIAQFRSRRSIPGDQLSARALGELDTSAPPPGQQEEHSYDYERLFEDGYLDVTVAVGYDEGGSHRAQLDSAHAWLAERGFERAEAQPGQPEQHRLRRDVTYPTRAGNRATREIIVRLSLIGPGAGAARQYGQGLAQSEITIYDGHARMGIGPDFDEDKSAAENFVIGIGSALHAAGRAVEAPAIAQHHYVVDRVNDLEQMTRQGDFNREQYRIWFFNACTTVAYFDELRGGLLPGSMDRGSLDLMGTRNPMPLPAEMASTLAMLDGILAADTIERIAASMVRAGEAAIRALPLTPDFTEADRQELLRVMPNVFAHEGAGDNPVAASP